jgi:hypothetical protein
MKTKTTLANTKLKVHDYVKHIDDDIRYRVVYIDLLQSKIVMVSLDEGNTAFTLDLDDENFEKV